MPRPSKKRRFVQKNIDASPESPGVYRLYEGPKVSYVGSGKDIQDRLENHNNNRRFDNVTSFDVLKTQTTREARSLEKRQIKKLDPPQNHA